MDLDGSNAFIEIDTGQAINGTLTSGDGSDKDDLMTEMLGALSTQASPSGSNW